MTKLTCPECGWTDEATGDALTDRMLTAAHGAEHISEDEMKRARRQAARPDAWNEN